MKAKQEAAQTGVSGRPPPRVPAPTPFSGLGIVGALHPLSDAEAATLDFSGSGELFNAMVGSHVCYDEVTFFGFCLNSMDDIFVYRGTTGM